AGDDDESGGYDNETESSWDPTATIEAIQDPNGALAGPGFGAGAGGAGAGPANDGLTPPAGGGPGGGGGAGRGRGGARRGEGGGEQAAAGPAARGIEGQPIGDAGGVDALSPLEVAEPGAVSGELFADRQGEGRADSLVARADGGSGPERTEKGFPESPKDRPG